ncbi:hypothetical protein BH23PLA1_BH23PLA1_12880 [soil metagenome]
MDPKEKRELRELKRVIKRAGGKRRRRQWKRDLIENPEGAHRTEENLGRYRSSEFNGLDRDLTRQRDSTEAETEGTGTEG